MKWYTKAAKDDHSGAQNNLGVIYAEKKEDIKALEMYRKAAKNGSAIAQYNLAFIYFEGRIVQKNLQKGFRAILLAAQQGYARAQYTSGNRMFYEGRFEEAYYWLTLAKKKEKDLEQEHQDSLRTLLNELEGIIDDHKKITKLQEQTGDGWKPKQSSGGSGFYVKENLILTNEHVIKSCNEVYIQGVFSQDYSYYRVDVEEEDPDVDLALLKISFDQVLPKKIPSDTLLIKPFAEGVGYRIGKSIFFRSAPFRSEFDSLQLGEGIAVFGYPLPGRLSFEGNFTIGNVSSIEGRPTDITPSDSFQFTAPIQRGNSGGPVLDAAGNVVGVAANLQTDTFNDKNIAQNINFAVSLKAIGKFLEKAGVEPDPVSSSDTRKEWTEIARAAKEFTVPVLCFTDKP